MNKLVRSLAVLTAGVLATSGCSLLGDEYPAPTAQFEKAVESAGSNQVTAMQFARVNGNWLLTFTISPPGEEPQDWGVNGPDSIDFADPPAPARPMTTQDFEAIYQDLTAQIPAECDQSAIAVWELAPSGAQVDWVECEVEGGHTEYLPGTARIDKQPVRDHFNASDPESVAAAADIFGKLFVDGKLLYLRMPDLGLNQALVAYGATAQLWDGTQCSPSLGLPDDEPGNPVLMGCNEIIEGEQPFDLLAFDPATIAGVRPQAAAHAGVPESAFQTITFISRDGVNLYVQLIHGNAQRLDATIAPR